MTPQISVIVAVSENWAIGCNNDLLYRLPADLRRFKELTTGHTVIMGRNTFNSLPKGALPNRRNIVLSSRPDSVFPGAEHFLSLEEALSACKDEQEVFIIGGGAVYKKALDLCQRIYLTRVSHWNEEATVFFPVLRAEEWNVIFEEPHSADEKHAYPYQFFILERK